MREIKKGVEPRQLTAYKIQPGAKYDGPEFTEVKNAVRDQLLKEQGHLCAYCMQRIKVTEMKVEHWRGQTRYPDCQLDFSNMLGCCMGNEGQKKKDQTCDTRKGDLDLKFSPAIPSHKIEDKIRYLGNGRVRSKDDDFDAQINEVLNLNYTRMVENRITALDEIQRALSKKPGTRSKGQIQALISTLSVPDGEDKLKPFVGVMLDYLEKRLQRAG